MTYPATVSLATSFASFSTTDVKIQVAGLSTDVPYAFSPTASITTDLLIGQVWSDGNTSVFVRVGNPTASAIASQASIPGLLFTTRGSQPVPEAAFAVALGSVSASGVPLPVYVFK